MAKRAYAVEMNGVGAHPDRTLRPNGVALLLDYMSGHDEQVCGPIEP